MQLLDLTFESVIENIAFDEALLVQSENTGEQFLRFWKPQQYAVVMGRSGQLEEEADFEFCRQHQIAVYRRPSGGGTILTGPGCLMYTVVLNSNRQARLKEIQGCHDFVLGETATALQGIGIDCSIQGFSDLACGDLKFSGNSLRLKRDSILYHGTMLCNFSLEKISQALLFPPKQPDYRQGRDHTGFVTNLNVSIEDVQTALIEHWRPTSALPEIPTDVQTILKQLRTKKYQQDDWNIYTP